MPSGNQRQRFGRSIKHVRWADGWSGPRDDHALHYSKVAPYSWNHSIIGEDDYKSPWEALRQGWILQAEVAGLLHCEFNDELQRFETSSGKHSFGYDCSPSTTFRPTTDDQLKSKEFKPMWQTEIDQVHNFEAWITLMHSDHVTWMNSPYPKRQRIDDRSGQREDPLDTWHIPIDEAPPLLLRQAFRAHLSFDTIHALQGLPIPREQGPTINTYGLLTTCQGKRTTRTESLAPQHVTLAIQQLWSDYVGLEAEVFLVQPQPFDHQDWTFLVVLDATNPPFDRAVPVLQQLLWEDYGEQVVRYETKSNYLQQGAHYLQICGMIRIMDQCLNNDCTILIGSRPVTYHVWADIHRGDLAQIFVPPQRHNLQPANLVNIRTFEAVWQTIPPPRHRIEVQVGVHAISRHGEINACFVTNAQRFQDYDALCRNIQGYLPGRDFRQAKVHCVHLEFHNAERIMIQAEFLITMTDPARNEATLVVAVKDPLGTQEMLLPSHPRTTSGIQILQRAGITLVNAATVFVHGQSHTMDEGITLNQVDYVVIRPHQGSAEDDTGQTNAPEAMSLLQTQTKLTSMPDLDLGSHCHQLLDQLRQEKFEMYWGLPSLESFVHGRAMINLLETWNEHWTPKHYHVYTDGSADRPRHNSSWAFAVILESSDDHGCVHFTYEGSAGGHHHVKANDHYIGGQRHQPIEAETSALFWACIWVLHQKIELKVTFHSDALAALNGTFGKWKIPLQDMQRSTIFTRTRYLLKLVQRLTPWVDGQHVKAHIGNPGNETADEIAKAIRLGIIFPSELPKTGVALAFADDLPLFWMQGKISTEYPKIEGNKLIPEPLAPITQQTPLAAYYIDEANGSEQRIKCSIRLATINSLTLADHQGIGEFDKRRWYQKQAAQNSWHIVGVQETRARTSRTVTTDTYYVLQSAAQKGHGGLEVWINKQIDGMAVSPHDFKVTVQHPRFLGVCLRTTFLSIDIYVVHAPPERGSETTKAFWHEFEQAISNRQHIGLPVCILGDLNSYLEECEPHVGNKDPEKTCDNGTHLLHMMQLHELFAPSTFESIHNGPSYTCTAKGHRHRIDYILLPQTWRDMILQSFVDHSFDMHNQKEDHHPLVVDLQCALITSRKRNKPSRRYDRDAAANPEAIPKLRQILQQMPEIPWETQLDDHVAIVDDYCLRALQQEFPCQRRTTRQPYFDHTDLLLIDDRRTLLKAHKEASKVMNLEYLRVLFKSWQGTITEADFFALHSTRMHLALQFEQCDAITQKYRLTRAQRRKDYVHKIVLEFQNAHEHKDIKRLHKALKPLRPQSQKHRIKTPVPLPGLQDDNGQALDSTIAIARQWEQAWGALELAESIDPDQFRPPQPICRNFEASACPGLIELEGAFRKVKLHKAPGLDGVGGELYKADPALAASRFLPLLMKEFMLQQVPIRHQGGLAVAVYKHRGSYMECQSYRSILLEPILGKCMAKAWRHRLTKALDAIALPMQHGARPGTGVLQNIHALRLRMRITKAAGKTGITLFLDLKSAFYAAMRALLIDQPLDEEFIKKTFKVFGLPPTAFDDFCHTMMQSKALEEAGLPDDTIQMVKATFAHSWFKVEHGKKVQQTHAGTRPGDPSADVLFAFTMTKCLQSIVQDISKALPAVDVFTPLTYVDDVAIHAATEASEALTVLAVVAQKVYDVMVRHGMRPSLGPGKTEGMVSYQGKGSRQCRRDLEKGEQPMLAFRTDHAGPQALRLVRSYKYLGAMIEDNENLLPEIRIRTLQAQGQMRPLRKTILSNPSTDHGAKRTIMQSLGLSKACYAIGTWPNLNVTQRTLWQNGIVELYRMLQPNQKEKTSVPETLQYSGLPTPQHLLRRHRFIVLTQMAKYGSAEYRELILREATTGPRSFLETIREDWHWYNTFVANPDGDRLPAEVSHAEMIDFITTQDGQRMNFQMMKFAFKCHTLQLDNLRAAQRLYEGISHQLTPGASFQAEPQAFACPTCGQSFATNTALSVHQRLKHKAVALARSYAWDSKCRWCLRDYHTRSRAITHLQYSGTDCLENLVKTTEPMTNVQRLILDTEDRVHKQEFKKTGRPTGNMRKVFLPAPPVSQPEDVEFPTPGDHSSFEDDPSRPPDSTHDAPRVDPAHRVQQILDDLWDATIEAWHESADLGYEKTTTFFRTVDLNALSDAQYRNLENEFVEGLQELSDICNDPAIYLRLEAFTDLWFPSRPKNKRGPIFETTNFIHPGRFHPKERYKVAQTDSATEDWLGMAEDLERETAGHLWRGQTYVPKPLALGELYCLLPFGGTRRYGDIPMWLQWGNGQSSHVIRAIVLDLGIHQSGDVLNQEKMDQWKALMWSGKICYLHSAPPCETWSAARWLPPPEGAYKPRPLRAADNPWLVEGRDPTELRQTLTGTRLMAATLELTVWAYNLGLPVSVEHPSTWDGRASVWSTKAVKWLLTLPRISLFKFFQSHFGQCSLKPTSFLLGNNHILATLMTRHIRSQEGIMRKTEVLQGLDANDPSSWATAKAKTYPPDLCRVIAEAAQYAARNSPSVPDVKVEPAVLQDIFHLCPPFDPYSGEAGYAPDYHR